MEEGEDHNALCLHTVIERVRELLKQGAAEGLMRKRKHFRMFARHRDLPCSMSQRIARPVRKRFRRTNPWPRECPPPLQDGQSQSTSFCLERAFQCFPSDARVWIALVGFEASIQLRAFGIAHRPVA